MRSLHPWPTFPSNLTPPATRPLALLFILQEWLSLVQLTTHLKQLSADNLLAIAKYLDKLLLSSLNNPFTQTGGSLDKLCFYCGILLQASNISDETIPTLLETMRNATVKVRTKHLSWSKQAAQAKEEVRQELFQFKQNLRQNLSSFFSALFPFLQETYMDENVLLYLIEHREAFNLFLGPRAIENLLRIFFPAGIDSLRETICNGYTRRGFAAFYTQQEPLLSALDW
ncbi:MAG: hypothetical protein HY861_00940 [Chlamydiia bacterium]|nr:hypothetical protein [Chlamydiia bacterium]